MTEAEADKVSNAVNELTWILDRDLDEADNRVRLAPTDRQRIDRARVGVLDMLQTAMQKAENKAERFEKLLEKARSVAAQGELFDGSGKPLAPADANGKVIDTDREFTEPKLEGLEEQSSEEQSSEKKACACGKPATIGQREETNAEGWMCPPHWVHYCADCFQQNRIEGQDYEVYGEGEPPTDAPTEEPQAEDPRKWGVQPLSWADVQDMLAEQVRNGTGKLNAIDAVVERTQWPKQQVQQAWNGLIEAGVIVRVAGKWQLVLGQAEATEQPEAAPEEQADPPSEEDSGQLAA